MPKRLGATSIVCFYYYLCYAIFSKLYITIIIPYIIACTSTAYDTISSASIHSAIATIPQVLLIYNSVLLLQTLVFFKSSFSGVSSIVIFLFINGQQVRHWHPPNVVLGFALLGLSFFFQTLVSVKKMPSFTWLLSLLLLLLLLLSFQNTLLSLPLPVSR